MESRSSRRFGAPGLGVAIDPMSHFSTRPSPRSARRSGGVSSSRSCSFITLLQVCLVLMCGSFFLQWWHWKASSLMGRDALQATANDRDAEADGNHANLRGREPSSLTFNDLEGMNDGGDGARGTGIHAAGGAPAPAPLEKAMPEGFVFTTAPAPILGTAPPIPGDALTETPSAVTEQRKRVFVPPTSASTEEEVAAWRKRFDPAHHTKDQREVAKMVAWAWKGYEENAFGQDYLNVKTMKGDGLPGHDMAITLVDSLDTLFLLGMFEQFDRASEWIATNMKQRIYQSGYISLFETTIRNIGGLLSASFLSGHQHLLKAAQDLGEALSPAFHEFKHGIPGKDFDVIAKRSRDSSSVAEAGSLQLEFKYLATATGERKYYNQVQHIMDKLFQEVEEKYHDGLLPVQISVYSGRIAKSKITLGAYGDSYYEYLLKQWLLSGKKDTKFKTEYMRAVDGIRDRLVRKSHPNGYVFIGELIHGEISPKMDHLVCFVPGMLALGYTHGMPEAHLDLAKQLIETCWQMYDQMEAKLAPEIAYFRTESFAREDLDIHPQDAFNIQRPETIESLMILYRVTKDEKYRNYGRAIMNAFETHCKLPGGGYTTINNVHKGPVRTKFREGMESFFLAETLKYLFLLFSDDETLLPLDEIVFNTEAHPFPMES